MCRYSRVRSDGFLDEVYGLFAGIFGVLHRHLRSLIRALHYILVCVLCGTPGQVEGLLAAVGSLDGNLPAGPVHVRNGSLCDLQTIAAQPVNFMRGLSSTNRGIVNRDLGAL